MAPLSEIALTAIRRDILIRASAFVNMVHRSGLKRYRDDPISLEQLAQVMDHDIMDIFSTLLRDALGMIKDGDSK